MAQPVTPVPQFIQPKLRVGAINDPLEREADRMAETVMRMPTPVSAGASGESIQRKSNCACGGSCSKCQANPMIQASRIANDPILQRQSDEEGEEKLEENILQRKSTGGPAQVSSNVGSRINSLKGGGQPLPSPTQQFFSSRMNYDFSQVRVHSGGQAAEAAQSVNARAFTLGRDVVFNHQEYQPESFQGKKLLAHELTHVVQQDQNRNHIGSGLQRDSETLRRTSYSDCTDAQETGIQAAVRKARTDMGTAISMLGQRPLTTHVSDALWLMFRDRSEGRARSARHRLRRIVEGLSDVTIECEQTADLDYSINCRGDDSVGGWVPYTGVIFGLGNIHLCMGAWGDLSEVPRAHTIIHEGMHLFNFASDYAYFKIDDCTETSETAAAAATVTPPLIPASRTDNADCYACLVRLLANMSAGEVANRVSLYQGGTLELSQSPEGTIDLNASEQTTAFRMGIPDPTQPGLSQVPNVFQFRWLLIDENRREYYLKDLFSDDNLRRYGPHPTAIIPSATRDLLRERGVHSARVYCRYGMQGVGSRLFSRGVRFTF